MAATYTVSHHREDLQHAMLPHMDDIVDFAFFEKIVPCNDYTQVLRSDSTEKPRRFFLVVQRCVTESRNNYDSFVKILRLVLPKGQSKQLLGKSGKTLREALNSLGVCDGMHKSFSEPTVYRSTSRPSFATSFITNDSRRDHEDREDSFNDVSEGGITFKCSASPEGINDELTTMARGVASPVEESGNDNKGRSELAVRSTHQTVSAHRRRRRNTVDDRSHTLLDAQGPSDGSRRAVGNVLFQLQNTRLECQQRRAQCDNHDKKVLELNDKLSAAIQQNEELASKTQRQNEEIESLRLKMNRKISELLRQLQASEQYKVMVSDLEVERNALRESQRELRAQFEAVRQEFRRQVNAISIDFEQRIQQVESARNRLQERQRLCDIEITRLKSKIEEMKKTDKVKPSFFCTLYCFALRVGYVAIFLILFLPLIFLYMWYNS